MFQQQLPQHILDQPHHHLEGEIEILILLEIMILGEVLLQVNKIIGMEIQIIKINLGMLEEVHKLKKSSLHKVIQININQKSQIIQILIICEKLVHLGKMK